MPMNSIVPLVGISKIFDLYDAFILGFDGVLTKGNGFSSEALKAIQSLHAAGKEVVVFSNSSLRVKTIIESFYRVSFNLKNIRAIVTAGEILHYKLASMKQIGRRYYNLGNSISEGVFDGLSYRKSQDLMQADFLFIGDVSQDKLALEDYQTDLEAAVAMHLPMVCVGTDLSVHQNGEIVLGAGSIGERYAMLGGQIVTVGKPDKAFALYAKEAFSSDKLKILYIGDSLPNDMKSADLIGADKLLVTKGIHLNALGEGYIPDVQKTRTFASRYETYPKYLISEFRW